MYTCHDGVEFRGSYVPINRNLVNEQEEDDDDDDDDGDDDDDDDDDETRLLMRMLMRLTNDLELGNTGHFCKAVLGCRPHWHTIPSHRPRLFKLEVEIPTV